MGKRQDQRAGVGSAGHTERSAATCNVLVIQAQPWSYDPAVGPKESLIAEVFDAFKREIDTSVGDEAQNLLNKLTKRVKWSKALKTLGVIPTLTGLEQHWAALQEFKTLIDGKR